MATAIAEPPHLTADLKALYLSTVASQWRRLAEQAARQRQAPADYLAQLVHLEVTGRRERRIQRRIQDARFPMLKTLDAFSFEAQPDLDRDAVLQVFDCRFVTDAANVVFVGGVGTGKTHLSIALGMACCQHDYRVRFVTAAELVTLLVEAQQQGRLARKLAQLARFDLRGNTTISAVFNYTDTEVTDNERGLLGARRLAEFAYALPRTRWNVGVNQRVGRMSFLGRVSYFGGWYDYDSGFAQVFVPSGGIEQGFFAGRPSVDLELSIALGGGATLAVGGQNAFSTYPQESARAMSVGEKYSEYTPWGFNGAYYYVRVGYGWGN